MVLSSGSGCVCVCVWSATARPRRRRPPGPVCLATLRRPMSLGDGISTMTSGGPVGVHVPSRLNPDGLLRLVRRRPAPKAPLTVTRAALGRTAVGGEGPAPASPSLYAYLRCASLFILQPTSRPDSRMLLTLARHSTGPPRSCRLAVTLVVLPPPN
ncbi:uncharacterized protein K460DRAFT_85123 [Cucurbitaria berberidis CBS 394.84]|uniref:Uncharacterized protein n=1 Tax=Cucurbitaria berberidis CBS 394.84 TaxID=1168544 RepID=A0A9P4GQ51_9PLEO|nr:uncharacterized protein K460DRAFT_85123 [Cucurbitaria berberidis CBS 394.84]KAF1849101.1 hypothetical protein K460DRAFT_85123 [Cucurbitaria berberidis CBS 394.84]